MALPGEAVAFSPPCAGDLTQVEEGTVVTEQGTSQRGCAAELAAGQVSLRWSARCDTAWVFWCVGAAEPGAGASPSVGGMQCKRVSANCRREGAVHT